MNYAYIYISGTNIYIYIYMAVAITLIQLTSAYLRYLPFKCEITPEQISKLKKSYLAWSLLGLLLNIWIFDGEVDYRTYKISLATGWIPYFIISVMIIGNRMAQHVFIFGMQGLWCFMLHSLTGMSIALVKGAMSEEFLPLQVTIYLILFMLLLRIEQKFFLRLLPNPEVMAKKQLKWIVAIFPVAIFIGTTLPIVEVTFLQTWRERLSRIFFPIFFMLIYRSISVTARRKSEKQNREQEMRELNRQMEALKENNDLIEKSRREISNMRKNLLEIYRETEELIIAGKTAEAKELIGCQTKILDTTRIKVYCREPLINAALSIYARRAEEAGIKISIKIDLPDKIMTDESDLAVLLSNLLENATVASKKQNPPLKREISLILRNKGGQNVLEITNRYDHEIKIGENGLPYTAELGHGLGMSSLEIFAKKYDAYADFSHENGLVSLNLYWNDYL